MGSYIGKPVGRQAAVSRAVPPGLPGPAQNLAPPAGASGDSKIEGAPWPGARALLPNKAQSFSTSPEATSPMSIVTAPHCCETASELHLPSCTYLPFVYWLLKLHR